MEKIIRYQFSTFGKYNVSPEPNIISKLMTELNKDSTVMFLPNIVNTQQVEIPTNKITTISNLGFIDNSRMYSLVILEDRIDFNYNIIDEPNINLEKLNDLSMDIMEKIFNTLDLTSNRLAVNLQLVHLMNSSEQLMKFGNRIINGIDFYKKNQLCEWSSRVNSQLQINMEDQKETINVITDIAAGENSIDNELGVLYHIDINTIPEMMDFRFKKDSFKSFLSNIKPVASNIIDEVKGLLAND